MTDQAGEVLSILVWHTVSNRERNIVRDSAWREKRQQDVSTVPTSTKVTCPVCRSILSSQIRLYT